MFGNNPIRPPVKGDGSTLDIQAIFRTFQGEGLYTGWPAVFIRLGGCNLACTFCDTEFESFTTRTLHDILADVESNGACPLVVITGGEPFRQPIEQLCDALIQRGYTVQIETNGTVYRPVHPDVKIICSPKNTGTGYAPLRPDLLPHLAAIKFLISSDDPRYGDIADIGQNAYNIPVYVQPMDAYDPEKNKHNIERTLDVARTHQCRLSLQTHKIWGIE